MDVEEQIREYIHSHSEPKLSEMLLLHTRILEWMPTCQLWYLDGKNAENKVVSNPNIVYGTQNLKYEDGSTKIFYQIGLSANKTGISVYILGIKHKKYLAETFGNQIGKASITGYCIKFKSLKDINLKVLESAIKYGISLQPNI